MKALLQKPLLVMALLLLPLWILIGNFILALISAILIGMLIGMLRSLYQLSQAQATRQPPDDPTE
ncbi:hypothetical protein [Alcaligenes endophyticus]|uniref:AI-2E family transporter n=1 Tax=Alcaligenes endophyticus TaxID=1929088 RepID=A0ABT8EG98_9BURK|nr:hypothetical protein [Alcaligenes endophyticus]MCX5590021.1 hypothetical protein [Alcaligenes endophyticus]MDN4120316.1 hypothetical protein [Alcaligenes endophyticus]